MKPVLIIAEIGSVHDGSLKLAKRLIETAAAAGADAVKFQTHIASAETIRNAPMPPHFKSEPRYQYFERTSFRLEEWKELRRYCNKKQVEFMSSPFSKEAVDLLKKIGMLRYKIPSGEVTNLPMIEKIAKTKKPVLLSSGMSNWKELDQAVKTIRKYHNKITLLQCSTVYPCPYEEVGLNVMLEMKKRYRVPVGLSDHTMTNFAVFAAVTLGASVIEKHFTLSRKLYGSDAKYATEPGKFHELVEGIRAIETMMTSHINKNNIHPYHEMRKVFQKSVVSLKEIRKGTQINQNMIAIKKPGNGILPAEFNWVLGKKAVRTIKADSVIHYKDIQ